MIDLPSPIEMQLLALVTAEERTGREVAILYQQETGSEIAYGTLYTTFRRLKETGWVKIREDQDEDGRVRYFCIDNEGRRALARGREYYMEISRFGLPKTKEA